MKSVILTINSGSSSIKFSLFSVEHNKQLNGMYHGVISGIGTSDHAEFILKTPHSDLPPYTHDLQLINYDQALELLLGWLSEHRFEFNLIAVGHRIVHGGTKYIYPVIINPTVIADLEKLIPWAPLQQPHNLDTILALQKLLPNLIQIACFDTAFHHTIPDVAHTLPLPKSCYQQGIRSYGFHGLSYEYIAKKLPHYSQQAATGRTIIAHLGQGASLCALKNSKSVATTMTFTPLDGLPMGTRCGSIDPAIVLYLLREQKMSVDEISDLLHHQSGLLGLSGFSSDMKILLSSDDLDAKKAIDVFVYRTCRAIAAMAGALEGLDSLVFTAGIGQHAALIRDRICQGVAWLGIDMDANKNKTNNIEISSEDSTVSVWVIPTDEEYMIALHTVKLALGGQNE